MKKLIVNADDFGLHPAINAGIIKGCRDGFITSTSLMCSGAAFDDAVLQAKATPALGVGIHLTLVGGGKPLLQARQLRTLVDEDGLLPADYTVFAKRWYAGRIKKAEVVSELQAQLERGLSCGLEITHVDSISICMCCRESPTSYWICAVHLVLKKLGCRRKAGFGAVDLTALLAA